MEHLPTEIRYKYILFKIKTPARVGPCVCSHLGHKSHWPRAKMFYNITVRKGFVLESTVLNQIQNILSFITKYDFIS